MKRLTLAFALAGALGASACNSSIGYEDPEAAEVLTIDFGQTDKQRLSEAMGRSLTDDPYLNALIKEHKGDDQRIRAVFGGVNNATHEHIDLGLITDSIRRIMLQSRKFRILASPQGQDEIEGQVRFQQGSGRLDAEGAVAYGRQLSADVVVYGNLRSIDKKKGGSLANLGTRKKNVYYQLVLEMVNVETAEIIWLEEVELTKTESKNIFQ